VIGLWVLVILARPFTSARVVLLAAMGGAFVGVMAVPGVRNFFALEFPPANIAVVIVIVVAAAGTALEVLSRLAASGPEGAGLSR
jgi:cation-transporting P-type ATPase E